MNSTIYKLSDEDYTALAEEIKKRLLTPCYFTGVVEVLGREENILRLTASLILYRRRPNHCDKHDSHDTICGVSAVWWDFVCEGEEGIIYDDFDFERFTKHLIEEE